MGLSYECAQVIQQGFCVLYVYGPRQGGFQQRDELAGEGFVFERRRNDGCANDNLSSRAQLAREVTVALPHELNDAQRGELVRSFVQSAFVDRGMIADVALHAPGKEGDQRNHHADHPFHWGGRL